MHQKPNAIVYLRRSGLVIAGKHVAPARLNFPSEAIDNLEVLRPEPFIAGCQDFFTAHDLQRKRVLMVLDHGVVFTKTVELDKSGNPEAIINTFVDAMPLSAGKRACVVRENSQQLQIYATNAELYLAVADALRLSGNTKLLAITPAAAYELSEEKQPLGAAVEQFVADWKVREQVNFMRASVS